jgi:signal peptidase II
MLHRKHWILILLTPGVIIADQVTKTLAHLTLDGGKIIQVIPRYLDLVLVQNRGMAFGLLNNLEGSWRIPIFIGISIIAIFIIVHLFRQTQAKSVFLPASLSLILAGAVGNLIDRFRWGYVVDFVNMHYRQHHWPTFNLADAAITIGIIILVLDTLFAPGPEPAEEKETIVEHLPSEEGTGETD